MLHPAQRTRTPKPLRGDNLYSLEDGKKCLNDQPSGQQSPGKRLELDDDVGELEVSLLLQVGQHSSTEEDLALTNAEQVAVQLQGTDLL